MAEMTEIDQTNLAIGQLASKVLNGKNRVSMLKLMHEEDPTITAPELYTDQAVAAQLKPVLDENAQLKTKIDKLEQVNGVAASRNALKLKLGIDDVMVDRIEKIMVEKGIAKHETAYEFLKQAETVVAPRPAPVTRGGPVTLPTMSKEFLANPAQGAREIAADTIDRLRSGKPLT